MRLQQWVVQLALQNSMVPRTVLVTAACPFVTAPRCGDMAPVQRVGQTGRCLLPMLPSALDALASNETSLAPLAALSIQHGKCYVYVFVYM